MNLADTIFRKHHEYYKNLGIETIQQQSGQAEQVSADYQGRVLFELLQNAFDKAQEKIAVEAIGNTLYIANDGEKFTYNSNHNYNGTNIKRFDFQSLCSISTSSKIDAKSIGNKGVGFKSVYSLARDGYVNIHTLGVIIENDSSQEEQVSFSVFESFKNENQVPIHIDKDVRETIIEKLNAVQVERKDRGIPGFYFPIKFISENQIIQNFFSDGYVTVIEIPFDDQNLLDELFKEIETIHFNFISLKHQKNIAIKFRDHEKEFIKKINSKSELYTIELKKENLESLAREAGVNLDENNKVAISYNENGTGLFYNYLPTKEKSPFKFLDFHADFRTTVDRKSIDFDTNSKIGQYNNFLLRACLELFFESLNRILSLEQRVELNITNILLAKIAGPFSSLDWKILQIGSDIGDSTYFTTRDILKMDDSDLSQYNHNNNQHFKTISILISNLAKYHFEKDSQTSRIVFFKSIVQFATKFTDDYNRRNYQPSIIFRRELGYYLRENEAQILPDVQINKFSEILLREEQKSIVNLPDFLGVQITGFIVEDYYLRESLGIKKFSELNNLLRYFRQVGINGEISLQKLTDAQHQEMLQSIVDIYQKKEKVHSFLNRYQSFLVVRDRENNSLVNNARFSVSTIFLKTNTGKFKPAQLCAKNELDLKCFPKLIENDLNDFLLFLGVSTEKNYKIVDGHIYNKLKDGIEYCPAPLNKEQIDSLTAKQILPNILVILPNGEILHPSLINNNKYPFLTEISNTNLRRQLYPLKVGDYIDYPDEFSAILLDVVKKSLQTYPDDVFRFYSSNVFPLFLKKNEFLVVNNGQYKWTTNTNFVIAKNRVDFEILKNYPIDLLAHFNNNELTYDLKKKLVNLKIDSVDLNDKMDLTTVFKTQFEQYIPFLLIDISKLQASVSLKDYLQDPQTISDMQIRWNDLIFIEGTSLMTEIIIEPSQEKIIREDKFQYHNGTFYFRNDATPGDKSKALAVHFFEISSMADRIELILFHKKIEELFANYDKKELELINSFWIPSYREKYIEFQKEILQEFAITIEDNPDWFIYNEKKKNNFLINLENENKLNLLERTIETAKQKDEYVKLFSSFQLRINRKHIQDKCSALLFIAEENDLKSHKITQLKELSMKLGVEEELERIEKELRENYPPVSSQIGIDQIDQRSKELNLEFKINQIIENVTLGSKPVDSINLTSESNTIEAIHKNQNQRIFSTNLSRSLTVDLESFGASGEEEVLAYFINEFTKIEDIEDRKKGIEEVYTLLQKKLRNDSHIKYKNDCLKYIENISELRRSLIPLFYVTLHHKFAFFDLIVYHNQKATLVEVKTTKNNNKFYISKAEINAARTEENYLLVRNTSKRIELLGNPIKQFEDQFKMIQGNRISIIPSDYEIILHDIY